MGAKDWMVFYADEHIPTVLNARPSFDRAATERLVTELFPRRTVTPIDDVTMLYGNPPDDEVYAAVWPGATVVCTGEVGLDRPSTLNRRFLEAGAGRTVYLHAMHSVVGWSCFALWEPGGQLRRSLSASPDDGVIEDIGEPLAFEKPFWAGEHPAIDPEEEDDEDDPFPLPFDPMELGEEALASLFGFVYEGGPSNTETVDPDDIPLAAFKLTGRKRSWFGRRG